MCTEAIIIELNDKASFITLCEFSQICNRFSKMPKFDTDLITNKAMS